MKVVIMFNVGILTISTKGSKGERQDKSGEVIREMVSSGNSRVVAYVVVTDDKEIISRKLVEWADRGDVDVILTTGGTGLSDTDVTPEATLAVVEKLVPGISEIIRTETYKKTPMAMLSRAVAGVHKKCLIINMPGSPKAVSECLEIVMPVIQHAVDIIKGTVTEHGAQHGGENQPHAH
jgi:molybdopterin adenylyltransferase